MGNSLGGAVALKLLTLKPDRVATLVLANSAAFGSEVHPMLRLVATPLLGRVATRYTTRASARMTERLLYVDQSLVTKDRIEHALAIARQTETGVTMHETSRLLSTFRGVRPQWRTADGRGDRASASHAARLGRLRPHSARQSARNSTPVPAPRASSCLRGRWPHAANRGR
jgi:pimeloyl-ACP methyl ester carboxylesterase